MATTKDVQATKLSPPWMYHPYLRQMCMIATMEVEARNTALDQHLLEDLKWGNKRVHWKPNGKVSTHRLHDGWERGFWASIAHVQGEKDLQRFVSCKKQFDFTAERLGNFLPGDDLKSEFKILNELIWNPSYLWEGCWKSVEWMTLLLSTVIYSCRGVGGRSTSSMFSMPSNLCTMFQRQTIQKLGTCHGLRWVQWAGPW